MAVSLFLYHSIGERTPTLVHLLQEVCLGAITYAASVIVFHRKRFNSYRQAVGLLRNRAAHVSA